MNSRRIFLALPCMACLLGGAPRKLSAQGKPAPKISFQKVQLDPAFRSEGVAVGDFNRDGKPDIAAGRVYYLAPDWKMFSMEAKAQEYDPKGYSNSFSNMAHDVNGDGWIDLVLVDWPGTPTYWYENPGKMGELWKCHVCTPVSNNESPQFVDVDGDGQRELVMGVAPTMETSDGPERQMALVRPQDDVYGPWRIDTISKKEAPNTTKYSHGLGIGDVNGDARQDVLVPQGWWEAPADHSPQPWQFHQTDFGQPCAQMYVYDFDGDGDSDVLSSSAHDYGIWWHEQTPDGWRTHTVDDSFSQTHALLLADINGDGLPDFVTGKRWWAHGEKGDRGADQPAVLFWYELNRHEGRPVWTPHQVDHNSGMGTQFEVVDVDGDGLLDVVTSNKKGVHYFQQVRR